jgi:hypothetical protein
LGGGLDRNEETNGRELQQISACDDVMAKQWLRGQVTSLTRLPQKALEILSMPHLAVIFDLGMFGFVYRTTNNFSLHVAKKKSLDSFEYIGYK